MYRCVDCLRRLQPFAAVLLMALALTLAGPAHAASETIPFPNADYPAGSIVIVNKERRLYFIEPDGTARRYPVAIGVHDEVWVGREVVTKKRENPRWIEPDEDGEGEVIEGGDPRNPLGKRAIYLGTTLWRIHGTIRPKSIGKAASNGCIRMFNEDVIDLYERVALGAEVFVVNALTDRRPSRSGRKLVDD
ncbi:MAG: L,D-transpeptidase [Hyphomicrobiaceae bacterium]